MRSIVTFNMMQLNSALHSEVPRCAQTTRQRYHSHIVNYDNIIIMWLLKLFVRYRHFTNASKHNENLEIASPSEQYMMPINKKHSKNTYSDMRRLLLAYLAPD